MAINNLSVEISSLLSFTVFSDIILFLHLNIFEKALHMVRP